MFVYMNVYMGLACTAFALLEQLGAACTDQNNHVFLYLYLFIERERLLHTHIQVCVWRCRHVFGLLIGSQFTLTPNLGNPSYLVVSTKLHAWPHAKGKVLPHRHMPASWMWGRCACGACTRIIQMAIGASQHGLILVLGVLQLHDGQERCTDFLQTQTLVVDTKTTHTTVSGHTFVSICTCTHNI